MQSLQNKKILLLAPKFFGYETEIKKELENLGANVLYFDERPKNDFFTKVFIRLGVKLFTKRKIENYYNEIVNNTEKIDFLFIISPESLTANIIKNFKKKNKNLQVILYMWDSFRNKKNSLSLLDVVDRYFTFDSNDLKIRSNIAFLPLFYTDDYSKISSNSVFKYDISFIGTIHSDRYEIAKQIEAQAKNAGLKTYFFFYSPSKILFFLQKLFYTKFRKIPFSDISFVPKSKIEVLDIFCQSKCILDINHPKQSGLTMRTLETFGAKRKLITTNQNIKSYDFFNEKNISTLNRESIILNQDFIKEDYFEIESEIYENYSLKLWVRKIFD